MHLVKDRAVSNNRHIQNDSGPRFVMEIRSGLRRPSAVGMAASLMQDHPALPTADCSRETILSCLETLEL